MCVQGGTDIRLWWHCKHTCLCVVVAFNYLLMNTHRGVTPSYEINQTSPPPPHTHTYTGGLVDTVYIHSEELTDITYVMDRVRVRVKAIGSLTQDDARTAARPYMAAPATLTEIKTDTMEIGGTEVSDDLSCCSPYAVTS